MALLLMLGVQSSRSWSRRRLLSISGVACVMQRGMCEKQEERSKKTSPFLEFDEGARQRRAHAGRSPRARCSRPQSIDRMADRPLWGAPSTEYRCVSILGHMVPSTRTKRQAPFSASPRRPSASNEQRRDSDASPRCRRTSCRLTACPCRPPNPRSLRSNRDPDRSTFGW